MLNYFLPRPWDSGEVFISYSDVRRVTQKLDLETPRDGADLIRRS
jgi:hypothetical protein